MALMIGVFVGVGILVAIGVYRQIRLYVELRESVRRLENAQLQFVEKANVVMDAIEVAAGAEAKAAVAEVVADADVESVVGERGGLLVWFPGLDKYVEKCSGVWANGLVVSSGEDVVMDVLDYCYRDTFLTGLVDACWGDLRRADLVLLVGGRLPTQLHRAESGHAWKGERGVAWLERPAMV